MTDPSSTPPDSGGRAEPPAGEPSAADALRAEIAATRAEMARAAEVLGARMAQRLRPAANDASAPDEAVDAEAADDNPDDSAASPVTETDAPTETEQPLADPVATTPLEAPDERAPEPEPSEATVAEPEVPPTGRRIIREAAVVSDRIEILPAPGRNLPALRPAVVQRGFLAGLAVAGVIYLLTRRRRHW